ncbi:cytochrome c [Vibrio sp.]|nr:cytochrome c [Vibrio sp.]
MKIRSYAFAILAIVFIVLFLILSGVLKPKQQFPKITEQIQTKDVPDDMSKGEYITRLSDCTACHTTNAQKPFAGGLAMPLPIGTIYSTNITPDKETGIGNYSLTDFKRVLREGIRKDGSYLYPAMPYTEYTRLSDSDIEAMYHYFMDTVQPVHQQNTEEDIPTILSMRWPLSIWNFLFHKQGAYAIDHKQSEQWNRGAYLVQGPTHCGTCHTPRGLAMESIAASEREKGFLSGAELAGWHAFNISSDKTSGLGSWSNDEIVRYLKTGSVPGKAQAAGPMAEAVENSFRYISDDDLNSIAIYLRSVTPVSTSPISRFKQGAKKAQDIDIRGLDVTNVRKKQPGKSLYMGNCAVCHDADGSGSPDGYYPSLYHNSVIGSSIPGNLIQVILNGVHRSTNEGEVMMPAFKNHLSDNEIATLVNFLNEEYGQGGIKIKAEDVKQLRN